MTTRLTCAQTPLAWTPTVALTDLSVSTGSEILLDAPHAGSLQVTTRRQNGGAGDGVTIDESRTSVAVDYRGQRYTLMEAIFQTPGLHVFPGQSDVYPAEYHLYFQTFAAPQRKLLIVIPVSHKVTGLGIDYFAAIRAQPDPSVQRPTLRTLFEGKLKMKSIDVVQYLGPDLRGRTSATPIPDDDTCDPSSMETMTALVLQPCQIRAADLERIPREGSLSSDPRDLPIQPRLKPTETVSRTVLQVAAVLSRPGLRLVGGTSFSLSTPDSSGNGNENEMACYPLEVRNGNDVILMDGSGIPLSTVTGTGSGTQESNNLSLRTTLFGEKETPERTAKETFWFAIIANVFLGAATWIIFRLLLFKESNPPVRATITRIGWATILFIAIIAGYSSNFN